MLHSWEAIKMISISHGSFVNITCPPSHSPAVLLLNRSHVEIKLWSPATAAVTWPQCKHPARAGVIGVRHTHGHPRAEVAMGTAVGLLPWQHIDQCLSAQMEWGYKGNWSVLRWYEHASAQIPPRMMEFRGVALDCIYWKLCFFTEALANRR